MNATEETCCGKTRTEATLRPQYRATEDENGATLRVALPGVRKEDLKLTLLESNLKIEATRASAVPDEWKTHRDTGSGDRYELNLRLTRRFDGSQTKAALDAGVLTLEVPVREDAKPREISVN